MTPEQYQFVHDALLVLGVMVGFIAGFLFPLGVFIVRKLK